MCLDHCTTSRFTDDKPSKSFVLNTMNKGNMYTTDIVGEPNDLHYIFRCKCLNSQAYTWDGSFFEPVLGWSHQKLSDSARPSEEDSNHADSCSQGETSNGNYVSILDFISGINEYRACDVSVYKLGGTPPKGETVLYQRVSVGLGLESDHSLYNSDSKIECSLRCGLEGFDTFWIWDAIVIDGETHDLCQCHDSADLWERKNDGNWVWNVDSDASNTATMCSNHNPYDIRKACKRACYAGGYAFFNFLPDSELPNDSILETNACRCYLDVTDCGTETHVAYEKVTIRSSDIFPDKTETSLDVNEVSLVGEVYDIVYPHENNDFECVQTQNEVLRHIDQQGLRGLDPGTGVIDEIGIPYTITPQSLTVKSVIASALFSPQPPNSPNFQMCYAYCLQQKKNLPRINSFAFKTKYKTRDMVYAGQPGSTKFPRCWAACNTDSDCEDGLTCQTRATYTPLLSNGVWGCMEPTNVFDQFYGFPFINYDGSPTPPLDRCYGGCTSDADCAGNLKCFGRTNGLGSQPVPGCDNDGIDDAPITQETDFCYDPGIEQHKVCGVTEEEYLDTFDCQCIDNDIDHECSLYTPRGETGMCEVATGFQLPFVSGDPLYNENKELECRSRCLRFNSEMKAFVVKQDDQSCACATASLGEVNYCKLANNDANYQVYDITEPFADSCDTVDGFSMEMELGLYTEPFAGSVQNTRRPPNPLVCNVESYLHLGTMVDTGDCECPLYEFEKMFQDTLNYASMPNDREYDDDWFTKNMHYTQVKDLGNVGSLATCKSRCDTQVGCVEVIWDTTTKCSGLLYDPTWYDNIYPIEWQIKKISDAYCMNNSELFGNAGSPEPENSAEECAARSLEEPGTALNPAIFSWQVPRGEISDRFCYRSEFDNEALGWADKRMDPRTSLSLCAQPLTPGFVPSAASNFEPSSVASSNALQPTYKVLKTGAFKNSPGALRAKKQILNTETNRYCDLGEVEKYSVISTHSHANPHYCMQECRKELMYSEDQEWILSRANVEEDTFFCYCSQTLFDGCVLKYDSRYAQYKVHKYSNAYSTSERHISRRDPQVSKTRQCKCSGYYIFEAEAFSCPENTFKNSGLCTSACTKCPDGQFSQPGSPICDRCPEGRVLIGESCEMCDIGEYATAVDNSCEICPIGRFNLLRGQGVCTACPGGWFDDDNVDGLSCKDCPIGYDTSDFSGVAYCDTCGKGRYEDEKGKALCKGCPRGKYGTQEGQTSESICALCNQGRYQDQSAQTSCLDCESGLFTDKLGTSLCAECPQAWYQGQGGQTNCLVCPSGRYDNLGGRSLCPACSHGKYSTEEAQLGCKNCPAGRHTINPYGVPNDFCYICPKGYYNEYEGQASCEQCAALGSGLVTWTWQYAANPTPSSRFTACDQVFDPTAFNDNNFRDGAYASKNFDCYKKSENCNRIAYGIFARRRCWLSIYGYGSCNHVMKTRWKDASSKWSEELIGATGFKWCIPTPNQVQRDEIRL